MHGVRIRARSERTPERQVEHDALHGGDGGDGGQQGDQQAHQTQPVPGIRTAGQAPFMIRRHRTICASVVYGMHAFIL